MWLLWKGFSRKCVETMGLNGFELEVNIGGGALFTSTSHDYIVGWFRWGRVSKKTISMSL